MFEKNIYTSLPRVEIDKYFLLFSVVCSTDRSPSILDTIIAQSGWIILVLLFFGVKKKKKHPP